MNARLEFQKGMVRPVMTYGTLGFLFLFTAGTGVTLFFGDKELSNQFLAIYIGLSTLTASIVSFWFGGRGAKTNQTPQVDRKEKQKVESS